MSSGQFLLLGAFVASAVAWVKLGRASFYYLIPLYVVSSILTVPFAQLVTIYPDRGIGGLDRPWPSIGDVLLVLTVLISRAARGQWRRPIPLALTAVTVFGIGVAILSSRYPLATVLYLGATPLRLALLLALLGAAKDQPRQWVRAVMATGGLFLVPVVVAGLAWFLPGIHERAASVGLQASDGRIAFPSLGNNKIGVCLLLLSAALLVSRRAWADAARARPLILTALSVTVLVGASASLRFATTAAIIMLLVFALRESPAVAAFGLVGGALGVFVLSNLADLGGAPIRALGVLSGSFEVGSDSSLSSRGDIWRAATKIWEQHPLIGSIGQWEWERDVDRTVLLAPVETHSEFMWQLATFGVMGLAVLVVALLFVLAQSRREGLPALVATVAAVASLGLNVATFFPVAATCLAVLIHSEQMARRASDGSASGVAPHGAVTPDRLAEGRVVSLEAGSHRHG